MTALLPLFPAAVFFAGPVLALLALSFRFEGKFPTLAQYGELLITNYTFLRFFWNSLLYASIITVLCVAISFPLGFLFAKVRFPGRDALFYVYVILMMLPFQTTVLPNYIQLRDFGLLNTPYALVLPLAFSPFAVFMFRQFTKSLSSDQIDSALLDTSSVLTLLRHVVFPHVKSAAAAMAVIIFCESWNMVEPVLMFAAKNPQIHPLSVTLGDLPQSVSYGAAAVYLLPIVFLFMLLKDSLASSVELFRWDT